MIRQGATTVWEAWKGEASSRNQYGLGSVCGFLFRRVAGIDAASPGFEKIVVRPVLDARVRSAGADYDSVIGRISTQWVQTEEGDFALDVTIPANANAKIHLPARRNGQIRESGRLIEAHSDIEMVNHSDDEVVLAVGSGNYKFSVNFFNAECWR